MTSMPGIVSIWRLVAATFSHLCEWQASMFEGMSIWRYVGKVDGFCPLVWMKRIDSWRNFRFWRYIGKVDAFDYLCVRSIRWRNVDLKSNLMYLTTFVYDDIDFENIPTCRCVVVSCCVFSFVGTEVGSLRSCCRSSTHCGWRNIEVWRYVILQWCRYVGIKICRWFAMYVKV